jgi:predicted ATP-dependent protease
VNQKGEVQAIGGVNEKIEGFFDTCHAAGLTGGQGVMIPEANVPDLMLRKDVVEAVAQGKFHVYPVATVEQGIAILTGFPAGAAGTDGEYPENSVYGMIAKRLNRMAKDLREAAKAEKDDAAPPATGGPVVTAS